ncbi:MAG: RNB domain-containing ribonuclease [Acidimicrobiia bacterium]
MPRTHVTLHNSAHALRAGFERIRARFGVTTGFPQPVEVAAAASRAREFERADHRPLAFITIDPQGSRDLDQAFHAEPVKGGGYRVHYAIADVAAFVDADDVVSREALKRGETVYLPDERAPLYPYSLGEGKASLLPGEDRPALVWTIDLDQHGDLTDAKVERSVIHSRRALSYQFVQKALETNRASREMHLLEEIGRARQAIEEARGGISLNLPSQDIVRHGDQYLLEFRAPLPVEGWNAQISLLTGIAAARIMVDGGAGLLRTLPSVDGDDVAHLRRIATSLRLDWPEDLTYAQFVRRCDARTGAGAAFLTEAAHTLRGAGYVPWHGNGTPPAHGALASVYAHVTAPLRRLADRYANEIVLALCAGKPIPEWAISELDQLPEVMAASKRRGQDIERASIDLVEAAVLSNQVGRTFEAMVVERRGERIVIHIAEPAIVTTLPADHVEPGGHLTVRLDAADPTNGTITFSVT